MKREIEHPTGKLDFHIDTTYIAPILFDQCRPNPAIEDTHRIVASCLQSYQLSVLVYVHSHTMVTHHVDVK